MAYVDLLDSAASAHPHSAPHEWWRPKTQQDQNSAKRAAEAALIVRYLHGETISLSNNQAVDSVSWLSLARDATALDIPWNPIQFVGHNLQYYDSEAGLVEATINYLSNSEFLMSAWGKLDDEIKAGILANLRNDDEIVFGKMLKGQITKLDTNTGQSFSDQAEGLQYLYEYLKTNRGRQVCVKAGRTEISLISKMTSSLHRDSEIPESVARSLLESTSGDLEKRSAWLPILQNLEPYLREKINKYLNVHYNEKLADSVSNGNGSFSVTDHDSNSPPANEESISEIADLSNPSLGLLGREVFNVYTEKITNVLTWKDFVLFARDEEFQKRALYLRSVSDELSLIPKNSEFFSQYRTWLAKMFEALNQHQEYLSQALAGKARVVNNRLMLLIGSGFGAAAGTAIAYAFAPEQAANLSAGGAMLGSGLSQVLADFVRDLSLPASIKTFVAGRIRRSLKGSIQLKSDEELLTR